MSQPASHDWAMPQSLHHAVQGTTAAARGSWKLIVNEKPGIDCNKLPKFRAVLHQLKTKDASAVHRGRAPDKCQLLFKAKRLQIPVIED